MSKRSFFRDIAGVFSSNIMAMMGVLLISVVLGRILNPEGYGVFTAIFVIPQIVLGIIQLGMGRSAVFHLGQKLFSDDRTVSSILFILICTSIVGVLASGATYAIIDNPNYKLIDIAIILMGVPLMLANIYMGGIFIGKEKIRLYNIMHWLPVLINLGFILVIVWGFGLGVTGALLAMMLATLIVFIYALRIIRRSFTIRLRFDKEVIKSLVGLGSVYALTYWMLYLNYKVDVLILSQMLPHQMAEVGFYNLGVSITEQLWILPYAVGVVVMSRTANSKDTQRTMETTAQLLRFLVPIGILAALVLFFVAPLVIPIVWGQAYEPSISIVQSILPGIIIFIVFRVLESHFAGMGKPWITVLILFPAVILNIILNFLWIPVYGTLGSVWATNISYTLSTIICVGVFSHITGARVVNLFILNRTDIKLMVEFVRKKWKSRNNT